MSIVTRALRIGAGLPWGDVCKALVNLGVNTFNELMNLMVHCGAGGLYADMANGLMVFSEAT